MVEWRCGLISDIVWDQRSASRPGRLTSKGKLTLYPFGRRLSGSRSRSGRSRMHLPWIEGRFPRFDSNGARSKHECTSLSLLCIVSAVRVGEKCNTHGAALKRICWSCCIRESIGASPPVSRCVFFSFPSLFFPLHFLLPLLLYPHQKQHWVFVTPWVHLQCVQPELRDGGSVPVVCWKQNIIKLNPLKPSGYCTYHPP
jgi:hypothetical protein